MELVYIRTDKNGTKIYHDWNCPRCGGAGQADKWAYTGRICYACGGTGKRNVAKIVKEYTPEYFEKLQAKRIERAKKNATLIDPEKEVAENQRILEERYSSFGCGKDGVGYILTGDTYPIKEQIKRNGGRWIYRVWICPVKIEQEGVKARKIDLSGHIGSGSIVWLNGFDLYDEINR